MFNFLRRLQRKRVLSPEESFEYYKYYSNAERVEIEKLFKRVFSGEEGTKALAYLQFITCQKSQSFNSTQQQLYFYEGQRSLVTNIIRLISNN